MPANTSPIFTLTPNINFTLSAFTANTTRTLTGGTAYQLFTAGANGSRIDEIRINSLGTNVATVMRFWINNGTATASLSSNVLFTEVSCPSTTVSEVAGLSPIIMKAGAGSPSGTPPLPDNGLVLKANYQLWATVGTVVAAGFSVVVLGGDY